MTNAEMFGPYIVHDVITNKSYVMERDDGSRTGKIRQSSLCQG